MKRFSFAIIAMAALSVATSTTAQAGSQIKYELRINNMYDPLQPGFPQTHVPAICDEYADRYTRLFRTSVQVLYSTDEYIGMGSYSGMCVLAANEQSLPKKLVQKIKNTTTPPVVTLYNY